MSADLLDQQIQFDKGTDGYYTIYLYNGGKKDEVLTCAGKVDNLGVGSVTTLDVTDNVYWAAKSSALGNRQKWNIVQLVAQSSDTILKYAQAYVQKDPTWDYLSTPGNFALNGCAVCALTICGAIINHNNALTPETCKDDQGFQYPSVEANWDAYGISRKHDCPNNPQAGYEEIYKQIKAGKPVVIHVVNSGGGHFITAYGYKSGTTQSNITASKILVIDPSLPELSTFQDVLDFCGSAKGYDYIQIVNS